jgi:uncharacterized membrane protein
MKKTNIIIFLIIVASFAVGAYFYPRFPEKVASHWNAQGEVDGYMGRFWGLFLMPIISVIMWLMFILIPKIDPMKKNIEKFRKYFNAFIVFIMFFLFYIYLLTIAWNMGIRFDIVRAIIFPIAILFYFAGVLMNHAERNWFIGIRTPWTLSSDNVWKKTHQLGAKLFKVAGVIALIGLFFPEIALWLAIIPALLFSVYTFVYSYFEHKKEEKNNS